MWVADGSAAHASFNSCVPSPLISALLRYFPTQLRRYAKNVTSLGGGIKGRIMGNEDFAMSDLLTSAHDLQYASRNFKFGLIPKVDGVCGVGLRLRGVLPFWSLKSVATMLGKCSASGCGVRWHSHSLGT
jgi:hypothetical protein